VIFWALNGDDDMRRDLVVFSITGDLLDQSNNLIDIFSTKNKRLIDVGYKLFFFRKLYYVHK